MPDVAMPVHSMGTVPRESHASAMACHVNPKCPLLGVKRTLVMLRFYDRF